MKKMTLLLLLIGLGLPCAAADKPAPTDEALTRELAAEYKVPEAEIAALRKRPGGWNEVAFALATSKQLKLPLSELMKRRDAGQIWLEIVAPEIGKNARSIMDRTMPKGTAGSPPKTGAPPAGAKPAAKPAPAKKP
jgi:hypothetical protein